MKETPTLSLSPVPPGRRLVLGRSVLRPNECNHADGLAGYSAAARGAIQETFVWIAKSMTARVRKHNRTEAICPFVEPAINRGSLFLAVAEPREANSIPAIEAELREFASVFQALEPLAQPDAMLKTLCVLFPHTNGPRLLEATDPARDLKADLLNQGILVGEFFASCPFAATFNHQLFPLRSPHPMYVLRAFLDSDWRFICGVDRWREIYRARFGAPAERLLQPESRRASWLRRWRNLRDRLFRRSPPPELPPNPSP